MAINTHLIVVLCPLLLHENNCTGSVTLIYILHEKNVSSANMYLPETFVDHILTSLNQFTFYREITRTDY